MIRSFVRVEGRVCVTVGFVVAFVLMLILVLGFVDLGVVLESDQGIDLAFVGVDGVGIVLGAGGDGRHSVCDASWSSEQSWVVRVETRSGVVR